MRATSREKESKGNEVTKENSIDSAHEAKAESKRTSLAESQSKKFAFNPDFATRTVDVSTPADPFATRTVDVSTPADPFATRAIPLPTPRDIFPRERNHLVKGSSCMYR
jgi:hypothetical protein